MIIFILILAFFAMITVLLMIDTVQSYGARKILKNKKVPCNIKNILVLGIKSKNKEVDNEMLADRLITAIEVNKENGNECTILLDKSGVSTYDSIYWAKEVFHIESMIIITNEHHLPRALYLAEKMGINAYGIKSDLRDYDDIEVYRDRELFAQIKDFVYVNILKPKHKK